MVLLALQHWFWRKFRRKCKRLLSGASYREISFVTIISGVTNCDAGSIQRSIMDTERQWRTVMEYWCPEARWLSRFELDIVDNGESPLGSFKRQTLEHLGLKEIQTDLACVTHLHALVVHPGLQRKRLALHLRWKFRGPRRVEVRLK